MNKLDTAYNQLKELSHSTDYHHYLHNKYYTYQQQLKTINNKLDKEMAHIQGCTTLFPPNWDMAYVTHPQKG